jgi:hypothetical protein
MSSHYLKPMTRIKFGLCVSVLICLASSRALAQPSRIAPAPSFQEKTNEQRARYRIDFALDFDARTYAATERVRWVNRGTRSASVVYFHLYANQRNNTEANRLLLPGNTEDPALMDEPRLEIKSVRETATRGALSFALDEQATLLRVNLRESVPAGAAVEIEIAFTGSVPEISADETSLPAHVIQQLGSALRDTRETRRARDTNFRARGVMLLGAAYPVLAVRDGDDWQREVRASVGDLMYTEVADYEVMIDAPADVALFTSGDDVPGSTAKRPARAAA